MRISNRGADLAVVPTKTLISFMLLTVTWTLTLGVWFIKWLTLGQWPDESREWIVTGISVILTIYHVRWGRSDLKANWDPVVHRGIAVTWRQALVVTIWGVCFGSFMTWLVVSGGPPPFQ